MSVDKNLYLTIRQKIYDAIDSETLLSLSRPELERQLSKAVDLLITQNNMSTAMVVRRNIVKNIIDELIGLGPLQALMEDEAITDIMVNGPDNVFIERGGLVEKSNVKFINDDQVVEIAKRIAGRVGRRVDESQPLCDARLEDGSRVNIVTKPIAIDGTSISIRKFRKNSIDLPQLTSYGTMSEEMARVLMIISRCRLNIIISGGTGSGKTTLLNALSQYISEKERIVTIEDAAELRLMQPHVVRLETRPASIEGTGEVKQRDLVINALRMRPDRIIVGECRGGEAFEMLQAMNTGHDGSMSTLHANTPRDALARIESMVMMATSSLPLDAIRRTIVSAIDIIIQVNRLYDGSRKVMSISEVIGLEGDNVVMEEVFRFEANVVPGAEKIDGDFTTTGLMQRSALAEKARFYGLYENLVAAFQGGQ